LNQLTHLASFVHAYRHFAQAFHDAYGALVFDLFLPFAQNYQVYCLLTPVSFLRRAPQQWALSCGKGEPQH